eukprot:TRINITY_DN21699_c0_g2_i2.p1 TRINITY_DN21699_c0_g2~~TRINITY_DN21699_c0_g2_i2.p1  ORF type:complete len:551 (-),score=100.24 TRINITY_DN21699_c0_g2_i2:199-1749(-)
MPELLILIKGMLAACRSVFFTLCLLAMVMFVFGIAFAQLCEDTPVGSSHFPTVPASMYTLLLHGTLLDDITFFTKLLGKESGVLTAIFFLYVLLAALTVMNMLIGVLCEVVSAVAATEREEMLVAYVGGKLRKVVEYLDTDGGGTISKKEFMQILENLDAIKALQDVGVDVVGLVDFADFIFEVDCAVDDDDEGVELTLSEFMEVVLQLRGSNNATVKDIVDLRKFVRTQIAETQNLLGTFHDEVLAAVNPLPPTNRHSERSFISAKPRLSTISPIDASMFAAACGGSLSTTPCVVQSAPVVVPSAPCGLTRFASTVEVCDSGPANGDLSPHTKVEDGGSPLLPLRSSAVQLMNCADDGGVVSERNGEEPFRGPWVPCGPRASGDVLTGSVVCRKGTVPVSTAKIIGPTHILPGNTDRRSWDSATALFDSFPEINGNDPQVCAVAPTFGLKAAGGSAASKVEALPITSRYTAEFEYLPDVAEESGGTVDSWRSCPNGDSHAATTADGEFQQATCIL